MQIQYRTVQESELTRELFRGFIRRQTVVNCLRRTEDGDWQIRNDPFTDDWSEEDYQTLIHCLCNTVQTGGFVCAAFCDGVLKGFVSVESKLFGGENRYLDLTSIHVSEDMRRKGIGKHLFCTAKEWAKKNGAAKLYISAHSAVESQAFYQSMGCRDATEINPEHAEAEPFDRQMECPLE